MFGLFDSDTSEEAPSDDKPCNVTGHDWPEWEDDPFSPSASSFQSGAHTLRVEQGQNRYCRKCDQYDSRKKLLGYIDVDRNGNLSVVNK